MNIEMIIVGLATLVFGGATLRLTQGKTIHPYFRSWSIPKDSPHRDQYDRAICRFFSVFIVLAGVMLSLGGLGILQK